MAVGGPITRADHWSRRVYRWLWRLWRPVAFRDYDRLRVVVADGLEIVVLPGVFDGVGLRSGAFLASVIRNGRCPTHGSVLDLGTGSGVGALVAARYAARVVATDINPEATRCALMNVLAHHLEAVVEVRTGDLFTPVAGERFDLILFNPPYYRDAPRDAADAAWRSPDAFDRFLAALPAHLSPGGRALIVLSTDGDIAPALAAASHLSVKAVQRRELGNECLTVYEIRPRYASSHRPV